MDLGELKKDHDKTSKRIKALVWWGRLLIAFAALNSIALAVDGNPIAAIWSATTGFLLFLLGKALGQCDRLSALFVKQAGLFERSQEQSEKLIKMVEEKDAPRFQ